MHQLGMDRVEPARAQPMRRAHAEDDQARWLMTWARANARAHPELDLLFAIPNGGWRDKREAARLKSMGVKAGVSDYLLPVTRSVKESNAEGTWFTDTYKPGLWLELKSADGRPTESQLEWGRRMQEQGYEFKVCKGWVEAAKAICTYLGIEGISP